MLVWHDDAGRVRFGHQQRLAQRPRTLPQDIIRIQGNDCAQGKDERMDVLAVQVKSGNGIGNGVVGEGLGVSGGHWEHLLGVQFEGRIPKLARRHRLQALTPRWQITVSLDPAIAVQVQGRWGSVKVLLDPATTHPKERLHGHSVVLHPCLDKGPVKGIPIVSDKDGRPSNQNVLGEALQQGSLVRLIENLKETGVLWLWRVLQVCNVRRHNLPIDNQETLLANKQFRVRVG